MKQFLIVLFSIFTLISCKEIQYVQVPITTTDTVYINKNFYDTLLTRDSIIIERKGDTIFQEKVKYIYKSSLVKDTVKQNVYVEKPVEVTKYIEVPKKFSTLDKILMITGAIAIALSVLWIAIKIKRACS